jgi:hypothetical protein
MKLTQRLQHRNPRQTGPGISLFPFLAVLICTMGALVPLLLAVTRTARLQAEAAAVAKMSQQGSEIETQRADVQWRVEQLKQSRAKTEAQVADARLELGHLEDHSRRLRDTLAQYQKTVADLEGLENVDSQRLAQSQAELEQVRSQIGQAQQQLAQAHQAVAAGNRSYAVVPFEGPNQTRRRPIYLECRDEVIVLQPEGIEFTEPDFEGPLGPGNPLAAALRAAREYMLAHREFDPQGGEPYPLLLVRPDGINAYYAARAAMKSWGFDFGYELVDSGWKLAYPPPDPRLADVVRQTIASARVSQARLIAAAPRQYGTRPKVVYRASPSTGGGILREGGSSDDDDRGYAAANAAWPVGGAGGGGRGPVGGTANGSVFGSAGSQTSGGAAGNPYLAVTGGQGGGTAGGGYGGDGNSGGGGGDDGVGGGGGSPALVGNGMAGGGYPQTPAGNAEMASGPYRPSTEGSRTGDAGGGMGGGTGTGAGLDAGSGYAASPDSRSQGGTGAVGSSGACPNPGSRSSGGGTSNGSPVSSGEKSERPDGYVVGQPLRDQPSPPASTQAASDGPRGYALRPGEWQPPPEPPPKKADDKKDKDDDKYAGKHKKSVAEKRGVDWGLRDAARGSVSVTRPIRVECYANRLVVVSERGPAANRVIAFGPRTSSSIDALISAVWEQMESWGMAGRGMYWRPVLQFYVAPDANNRFAELSSLLNGSGLMVERK